MTAARLILGVDPGLHGAVALYDPHTNCVLRAQNIPVLGLKRNGKDKLVVNIAATLDLFRSLAGTTGHCFLELVNAMPKQGATSMFAFGRTAAAIETAIAAAAICYSLVTPQSWKKSVGAPADKDATLLCANQLMPASVHLWTPARGTLTKDDAKGVAEAALIAYYGAHRKDVDNCVGA